MVGPGRTNHRGLSENRGGVGGWPAALPPGRSNTRVRWLVPAGPTTRDCQPVQTRLAVQIRGKLFNIFFLFSFFCFFFFFFVFCFFFFFFFCFFWFVCCLLFTSYSSDDLLLFVLFCRAIFYHTNISMLITLLY